MKKILTSWWFSLIIGLAVFIGVIIAIPRAPTAPTAEQTEGGTNATEHADAHPPDAVDQILTSTTPPLYSQSITPVDNLEAGAPGELQLNSPVIKDLIKDLQKKRTELDERERELNNLAARIRLERDQFSSMTQAVAQATIAWRQSQTNRVIIVEKNDDKKYSDNARMFTNMLPTSAAIFLEGLPIDEVVQLLQRIPVDQRAAILEPLAKGTNSAKAIEISKALLRIGTKPENP